MRVLQSPGWKTVFVREIRRFVSKPIYIFMVILFPLGFLLFFSTFMQEGLPQKLPIGIIDHDQSSISRSIVRQIDLTQQTKVAAQYLHFSEARNAMQKGEIYGFVDIPKHLKREVLNGNQPTIHYYYNQSYLVAGSLVLRDLGIMLNTISGGINLRTREAKGQNEKESMAQIQPIVPEIHAIGNPSMNYAVYMVNILLPGMLQLMVLLTIVYCIGTELKKSSSKTWLKTAGNSMFSALFGKLLPYTILFSVMGIFYEIFLFKFMNFPLSSDIGWMLLDAFLLVLAAESIAILMIGAFPVLRNALCFSALYGILAFSYSGLVFPIEGMPATFQGMSYTFPLRFFFRIYQNVALNQLSPIYSILDYGYMLAYLILPVFIWKRLKTAMIEMNYPKK